MGMHHTDEKKEILLKHGKKKFVGQCAKNKNKNKNEICGCALDVETSLPWESRVSLKGGAGLWEGG